MNKKTENDQTNLQYSPMFRFTIAFILVSINILGYIEYKGWQELAITAILDTVMLLSIFLSYYYGPGKEMARMRRKRAKILKEYDEDYPGQEADENWLRTNNN
jgi:hypothetical protein